MYFVPPAKIGLVKRTVARIAASPVIGERLRRFRDIVVHPTQEMREPEGSFFRGGPEWPHFGCQVLARHCWGAIPKAIDSKPMRRRPQWPYFEPRLLPVFWPHLGLDRQLSLRELENALSRLAESQAPLPQQIFGSLDTGIWCGPISLHFGHMITDFGMRTLGSSRVDATTPLVFSLPPFREPDPPPHFWQIIDHLGVDRRRVLLLRTPTRFRRLYVLPQAERPLGGGPSARHLDLMDELTSRSEAAEADLECVFVSRAGLAEGRFAGESYLDRTLTAAGVKVLHPETVDLSAQLRFYQRARLLIFSEGSALHALQLLGRLACDVVVLVRRPGYRVAAASLQPRVRSLRYVPAARARIHPLSSSGRPDRRAGMSLLDERLCLAALKSVGVDLARFWEPEGYAECRDGDIEAWRRRRQAAGAHPGEAALIEEQLRALSLRP